MKLDPKKLTCFYLISNWMFQFIFIIWDFFHSVAHIFWNCSCSIVDESIHNEEENRYGIELLGLSQLQSKSINYWMYTLPYWPNKPHAYSVREYFVELCMTSFFMAFFLNICKLQLSQTYTEKRQSLRFFKKLMIDSLGHFQRSEFLRASMNEQNEIYLSVLIASDENLIRFLDFMAKDFLSRPRYWHPSFVQFRYRLENAGSGLFKRNLTSTGVLFSVISQNCVKLCNLFYCKAVRRSFAGIYMLAHFCGDRDTDINTNSLTMPTTGTRSEGFEDVLIKMMRGNFRRLFSFEHDREFTKFNKDRVLTDIEINLDCKHFASEWEEFMIDRACWVCTIGRKFLSMRTLHLLQSKNGQPNLDLTMFTGLELLAFSVSGLVCFEGRRENLFKHTGNPEAKIFVRGYLPRVRLFDFLKLGLAYQVAPNRYAFKRFPGLSKSFKAVNIGKDLLLVKSEREVGLVGNPSQIVC